MWTALSDVAPARCPRTTPTRTAVSPRPFRVRPPSGSRSCPDLRRGRAPMSRSPTERRDRRCRRAVRAASAAGSRPESAASTATASPRGRHPTTVVRRCLARSCRTTAWDRHRRRLPRQDAPVVLRHRSVRYRRRHPRMRTPPRGACRRAAQEPTPAGRARAPRCRSRCRSRISRARRKTVRAASTSSPHSLSTAVTSRRLRARPMAAISSLRSSASSGARLDTPVAVAPSVDPRRGHRRDAGCRARRRAESCWATALPAVRR